MVPVHRERPTSVPLATPRENNRSNFVMSPLVESPKPRLSPKARTPRPPVVKRPRSQWLLLEEFEHRVLPSFTLGAASNYAILFEGGTNGNTLQFTSGTTNTTGSGAGQGGGIGNIGIGMAGKAAVGDASPVTINGRIDFSASDNRQFSNNSPGNVITAGVNYNVAAVTSALSTVNALNTTLGALSGPSPNIDGNTTINVIDGTFHASGTGYTNVRVFTITAFNLNTGQTLTVNGDANGDSVVFNVSGSTNIRGSVALTGGLTPDNVIFNFVGGDLSGGGPDLNINNGGGSTNLTQGIILDPHGMISVSQSNILGRIFGGDSRNLQFTGPSHITAPSAFANPTLVTTPNPTTVTLNANPVTLTDSATLSGGNSPAGTITFTLFRNGGATPVDTESVTVNGNGTYTTPTGFALPATGTATGTYQWDASYGGDNNNNPVSDAGAANEQVTVSAATPAISTTPNPATVMLGGTLQDTASLTGGYHSTGSITFNLFAPGVDPTVGPATYTETVSAVNGNGTYQTTVGFVSNATGVWHWVAAYGGDANNNTVASGPFDEPVTIPPQADLALAKTVSNASPNVGSNVTFLVTLSNLGPDFATGVTVQDLLPAGLTFVSATPSQGTYNAISGQWNVGVVDPSIPRTLALVATVVSSAAQTNSATISGANQFDPVTTNNTASATETPQQADLMVTKSVSNATPNVGDTITFTVTVTNHGPSSATNVQVNDLLPTGLVYVSSSVSQGNYFSTTGTWTVGNVNNGAQATLTLLAQVASPTAQINTATAAADQFDPNSANNTASATETPQQADLAITKTVSDSSPNVGENVTFTILVTNDGPNSATNVAVQELLGTGLAFVSDTPSQGTYDPTSGVWTVGTVGLVGAPTLDIMARATTSNVVRNTASIKHSDQFDPVSSNNSDSIVVKGSQADLAVTNTVDRSTASVGDTVTFTIAVTNLDGSACNDVQVTDMLPVGLQYDSSSTADGTYNNVTGIWALAGTLTNGESSTLTIQATMLTTTAQTNTATITSSDRPDPDLRNNSDSATVNPSTADLVISKSVNDPTPNVGANITYTIRLTNSGPDTATDVTVQDTLPAGVTFVSATPAGSYDPVSGVWTVGTVSVGTPQTLAIVATVTRLLPDPNTASIGHSDQFDPITANNSDTASIDPVSADLSITKTVSNAQPNVGDTIAFTVSLTDAGPASATNVGVIDLLPAGLTFAGANLTQGNYAPATGTWTVGTLASNATVVLTLQALVVSSSPSTNTAAVSHTDQFDPNLGNNSDTATVTPQQADLAVSEFVDNATPNIGDTVNFTINIDNIGPSDATNVLLNDLLPAGLAFVSANPSQGSYNPSTGVWTVGTVPDGVISTLIVSAQVVISGAQINTAAIGHSDQADPNTANNQASATVTALEADLQITKTVSNATPNVGDTIAFTITLTDLGPGIATNVQVNDLLPTGLTLVSADPSQGTYDSATGLWSIPTVTTALARTLILSAHVDGPGTKTNTVTITASDVFDPNPGNNTASATETPQQADLGLTKTVSNARPNVGDTITFTVTMNNAGPDAATHVQVADLLPAGFGFVMAIPSQGTYSNVTGLWDVGALAANAGATLQLLGDVNSPSPQLNTATVSQADQFDPDSANNSAGALEVPQQADLSVRKSVSNPTPNVGETLTYTVLVTDNGPDAATGVVLSDVLPSGVSYQTSSATAGTYNPATRDWTVGAVANGVTQTLTILATVVNINPQANTATISHADQFDPDLGNNFDTASINPQAADLQVAKTVSNPTPNVGDTITFTVTLTNDGPSAASNVQVTDLLPDGLSFVSATPSPGTNYNSGTGLWTVGTVTTTTPQTLAIQARVDSPSAQTNTAAISAVDQFDPDPANDQDSATETPQVADLVIAKAVSDQTPNVGDIVTFIVAVADKGPNAASNVTVQDLLPAGLSLISFLPSRGTYDPTTGIWNIGAVDPSAAQTLILNAHVVSPAAQTNTATISHGDQFDPVTTNNSASATETPQQADLVVDKTVSNARPNIGDVITYTVTVNNAGPDPATGVQLTDKLPAGLTLLSAIESQGVYNSRSGTWIVGQIGITSPATLTLRARVASPAPTTNIASIGHSDQFDPIIANNIDSATETPQPAISTAATVIVDANRVPVISPILLGMSVQDTATIGGQRFGLPATGTLTYEFFTTIDGSGPHTDEVVNLNSNGTVPDSAVHGPLAAGAYSFVAIYSGDSNYTGSTSTVEPLTVGSATSAVVTEITDVNHAAISFPFVVPLGTSVQDTATITGQVLGMPATGTVTYEFFTTVDGTGPHSDEIVTLNPDGSVPATALHGPLAAGAHSFVAVYSGDSNYLASTSAVEPLTVKQGTSSSATVIVDANHTPITSPAPLGTTVSDTATVAGDPAASTPTGKVTYEFFTTIDGTGPHTDQAVTLNPDGNVPDSALQGPLATGAYSFIAVYSGDSNYFGSTSPVEPLTVQQGTSTSATVIVDASGVAVTSSVALGTTVGDTATVAGTPTSFTPTGTVTYQFFTTIDGTGTPTDEVVTLNADGSVPDSALNGPLAAGAYSFIAVYSGDSNYAGSSSPVEPLTVQQGTSTSATVIVDAGRVPITSPVPLGTSVHDTATISGQVSGLPATGNLTYELFTTIDGTGAHSDEVVTLNPDGSVPDSALHGLLAAGAYSFIAVYSGDSNYAGSTSVVEPLTVESEMSAVVTEITDVNRVAIPFPYNVPVGTSVHDTATITRQVSGLPASGTLTYEFFTTIDGTGTHTDEVVNLNPDGTVPDSALHGPLAAGAYSFVAVYNGDSNYTASTSPVEPLTVGSGTSAVVTQITDVNRVATPFPFVVALGALVQDTATITGQAPGLPATGTLTYEFFMTIDGTGTHTDEVVALNPDGTVPASALHGTLAAGADSFIAVYSGDSNYAGSTSAVEPLLITRGTSTSATVIVDANHTPITSPAPLGAIVGDTATVAGAPAAFTPTGSVTYQFFTTIDGTGPHTDQTVTLNLDGSVPDSALQGPLATGAFSFIAVYSGDSNYVGSTSPVEPLTVQQGTSTSATVINDASGVAVTSVVPLGTSVRDTSTISGQISGLPATGTLTYEFFTTIDGTGPHTDEVVNLNPDGTVPDSALHGPLAAGAYSFIAVYSGDDHYSSSTSPVEPLTVQQGTSTSATVIVDANRVAVTSPVLLGTSVHDTATIGGQRFGLPATGTLRYEFFTTIDGSGPHTDEVVNLNPDGTVPDSALHGPLAAGAYSFITVYSGDSNYTGSTSPVEPLTVGPATSAVVTEITDVNRVATPFPFVVPLATSVNDNATITAQAPGLPATGTLTYEFFTTIDGTGPHTDEVVALNLNGTVPPSALHGPLAAGAYSFIAVYSGDSNYTGSTSAVEPLSVGRGTSTSATVIVDANHTPITSPAPLGAIVGDTATVAGAPAAFTPSGTVTYEFFTTIDGTGPHADQTVMLNPDGSVPDSALQAPLATGAYSFIALYSGDSNYAGSTSPVEPLMVQQGTSTSATVIVDASGMAVTSPAPLGSTVGDTATVVGTPTSFTPTGTVTYEFFTTIGGTGPHTDQTVTLNPDGSVPDSSLLGPLAAGAYSFIAVYNGDSNYVGSTSPVEPLTVQQGTSTSATVIVDAGRVPIASPIPLGTSVHDTATISGQVSALPATGTLTYEFFTTIDGTGPHTDQVITLNPDGSVPDSDLHGPLAAGAYSFIALYSGDSNYAGSTSPVEPLTVQQVTSTAATAIVDANGVVNSSLVPLGTTVHDTAKISGQVSGLAATGTLTYEFFTTIDGTGAHTDEDVTLNPDGSLPDSALHGPLAAGAYSFVAVYSGDSNYLASTSAVEPLTVQQGTTSSATVIVDSNGVPVTSPVPLGTTVSDTATVAGAPAAFTPTGTVTYQFFTTIDGTGPHSDQTVSLNPDGSVPVSALLGPLAAGAYSFVAVYSGDSNYVRSTSAVEPLTVQQETSSSATVIVDSNGGAVTSPVPLGTTVADTATVASTPTAFTPTGTLTYEFFTTIDGTGPHTDEIVTLNPDGSVPDSTLHGPLAAGVFSFIALYSGDNNYSSSTSPVEPLTVQQGTSIAATVIVDASGVAVTSPVPLAATVRASATVAGTPTAFTPTGTT